MIELTEHQLEIIKVIDRLMESVNLEDLKKMIEKEEIILKLKGEESSHILTNLLLKFHEMNSKVLLMEAEYSSLKYDFTSLLRYINNPGSLKYEFDNLKSRHGIYY